ncbi:MAG: T9SS type A sorting domain-containing protein [Candidatus Stahlbacteria bacterium]|nr:T9SS type A sorting domain-containing protein [Candidatus Stahlbacteria bacterium]
MWYILLSVIFGGISRQTDWMGGDGVLGPKSNWGTQYLISDSVTAATAGQVSLIATQWNYSNWVTHILENTSVDGHNKGLMPADIDRDGIIDLIAWSANQAVWYKHDGLYNFAKQVIGDASGGWSACVWPSDIDQDGDVDVLVAANALGWYENQLPSPNWSYHLIEYSAYPSVVDADVELDGDIDIIVSDGANGYLFRNDGAQSFAKEFAVSGPDWRTYVTDFNNDGYPDLYCTSGGPQVFMNNGTGGFTPSFNGGIDGTDGVWASDINMDGAMDIVSGLQWGSSADNGFYASINNGTGNSFNIVKLTSDPSGTYMDGAIARDIDLDGLPDIAGAYSRVGWFRQNPGSPLTFNLYDIGGLSDCHYVHAAPLSRCTPKIDILVTNTGSHIVYENRMHTSFASFGYLESSILEITPPILEACDLLRFGYIACVPENMNVGFCWRAGGLSSPNDILTKPWHGPYYTQPGMLVIDSFTLANTTARTFQYKVEMTNDLNDIPVLYEVWVTYTCSGAEVEESQIKPIDNIILQVVEGKLILSLEKEEQIKLTTYDIAGRIVKTVFDGSLPAGKHKFGIPDKHGIYFAKTESNKNKKILKFIKLYP